MKQILLITILVVSTFSLKGQEKVLFHKYGPTASSWKIYKWNIPDPTNEIWILKETVDEKGRVIELEFLKNGKLIQDHVCYLADRVTFKYEKDKIIQELFYDTIRPVANECEMYYKTIYHLKNEYIDKVETFYRFDTINYTPEEVHEVKKYVPEHFIFTCNDSTNTEIEYYYHSFAKLNGIYPVNKGYKFEYGNYYYDQEPVNTEILKGIKKIKNNR
jgi:hypothetical protein